ncbi:7-carboxy-7-deazaguanine synthase [Roseimaritima multifibrata]|uniref:7-carboxy-7-deazaguanine synthase n=1 Tax=Roseimaritima multifibrata TaxID=1930274 RepID=A0A517MEK0_9BACT|nr:7-carboxy-7-deazaguanine synthase QueE [Roseimaritima multifibrata]QDS93266.1 7-carboxy-7-deazaguanine synthase [Roseimaritima multifibrata]
MQSGPISARGVTAFEPAEPPARTEQLKFPVSEIFNSRQGEGKLTGVPSHFIRLAGCNLRCWFCDTPYASWNPQSESYSLDDLVQGAIDSTLQHVVLTGGEPLMFRGIERLTEKIRRVGLHLTIETAGTLAPNVVADLMSLSPKRFGSQPTIEKVEQVPHLQEIPLPTIERWQTLHESRRWKPQAIQKLIADSFDSQVKFVVDNHAEAADVEQAVSELQLAADQVWIMPQGVTAEGLEEHARWIRPWCEALGFHFCDRQQIHWYGNRPGT